MAMNAGTYYIGDLCYVMHDTWNEVCKLIIDGNNCLDGEFTLANGVNFATYGTAYGDGTYTDQYGKQYGVDAGLIGCILLSDINLSDSSNHPDDGHLVEFNRKFETSSDDGIIYIGHIVIDTKPDDQDEDYWNEEEDEDE